MIAIEHPIEFKQGVRILIRTMRNKDGDGNAGDRSSKKLVTTSPEEFEDAFYHLASTAFQDERIYSTVEARDPEKAIHLFKVRQLEADLFDTENRRGFYIDIWNRWISCLQSPQAKANSVFLFDCDDEASFKNLKEDLEAKNVGNWQIKHTYRTKNGWHVITEPFNPNVLEPEHSALIHKNALMLLAY